ncbi:hypothetical protein ABFS83_05G085800 [Erythranthe nasuta]
MEERMVELEKDDDGYLLSTVTRLDGFYETYSESELKQYLNAADDLSSTREKFGWVFWRESESEINEIIKRVLQEIMSDCFDPSDYMVQFWAAKEEREQVNYLITSDQPFAVGLYKGFCWYRKKSLKYQYYTEIGPVGRAYRSKHPEFSPDLRLYSTSEFPLGDYAARCGMRSYMAIPIFDLNNNQHCYGVLEFLCFGHRPMSDISLFLWSKGLISAHANHVPVSDIPKSERQLIEIAEIKKMVERAMDVVPQLHLAVVWVSRKQCSEDISTDNLSCMEISNYITYSNTSFDYSHEYRFNNVRKVNLMNKKSSFCGNICDFRMSAENPRAHFAQLLRLSVRYEICLESMQNSNEVYIVEFFLQSNKNREDGSFVYMLSRIMEMELKSIKLSPGGQLGDHQELLVVDPPHALRHESINYTQERKNQLLEEINMLEVIEGYYEQFSLMDFTKYLQKTDPFFGEQKIEGGYFWRINSFQPHGVTSYSSVEDKIKYFMSQIIHTESYSLVQFWAPKFEENRCCITTFDQPFSVGSLKKGLASFRKQSMEHVYYVDEGAKDEQVGPPGRVFRSRSSELTPDMRLYSTTEFPLKNHVAHCHLREYFVLPIFDLLEREECVGVLEFVGFTYFSFGYIKKKLAAANLSVSFHASHMQTKISDSRKRRRALHEIQETIDVVLKIPQLHRAEVWATCTRCAFEKDNSLNCMELTRVMNGSYEHIYSTMLKLSHIHTRKGITGMVLASKNKSCFFRNSCHFSIVEQPLAHYLQKERRGSCFAICLQSTHTGSLVYVLEFFLNQGPGKYGHIVSVLNFLLPILEEYLESFTIASGQQLGDELAIEVPVFPGEDELILSEIKGPQNKFKFVPYCVGEHQDSGHQQRPIIVVDDTDSVTSTSQAEHLISSVAVNAKKIKKGKKMKKTGRLNLTLEALKPHFGTKLKDVAMELGVSISTIKRACREYGIDRWPCNENHKKNPSLFEVERADKYPQKNICNNHQNLRQASTDQSSSSHLNVQTIKADTVIVKAKYDDDTIRFELDLPLGMEKLVEEVANRLELEMGSFKLKYLDEENEEISLTRDSDLLHCPKYPTASGESFIKLLVRLSRK